MTRALMLRPPLTPGALVLLAPDLGGCAGHASLKGVAIKGWGFAPRCDGASPSRPFPAQRPWLGVHDPTPAGYHIALFAAARRRLRDGNGFDGGLGFQVNDLEASGFQKRKD